MSGAITAFASIAGAANFLETILIGPTPRGFNSSSGLLIPNCAIEERHLDRLIITQHPVEVGAAISDHVYKLPTEVTLRWAWTDAGNGDGFVKEVYQLLQIMQVSGTPFFLFTGKASYQNMMLTSLMVTTEKESERALMVVAVCQQIIIVSTASAQVPPQDQPQQTNPVNNVGQQSPTPVPAESAQGSDLSKIFKQVGLGSLVIPGGH